MSAIGITVIEDGEIQDSFYSLVDPETYFDYFNTLLTGISEETVCDAPTFPEIWERIEPILSNGLLVAHNAVFDLGVLRKCLQDYGIVWKPYVRYVCTVQMGRRILPGVSHKLNDLCARYGIDLDHHHAGSDSRACAEILLRYLRGGAELRDHIRTCSLNK
jgi:DNA polymerase-3 subunit epsilon